MINVEKVNPTGLFTNYIYKAIPLAFDESMSYYETLCGLLDYLKNTINPTINNNADALIELQNYVTHYFDSLDVQEEINNKLDEMVESGELESIIASYLNTNAILGFNTLNDLKNATNIIEGSFCKTLGKLTYNDGNGSLYKIRTITSSDIVDNENIIPLTISNTLIAEKIINNKKNRKLIMIGDSYGAHQYEDITKFYWENLQDALNLETNKSFFNGFVDGASFGNNVFLNTLISIGNNINKKEITDIFVCGGFNDSVTNFTEEYIINQMSTFDEYVKNNFPNAKITIAHIGYSNPKLYTQVPTSYNVTNIIKSIDAYKKGANQLGWNYVNGIEYVLKNYDTNYWQTDGVHPSQLGQNEIGKYIVEGFINGNVNIIRTSSFNGIEPSFESSIVGHSNNFKFINTLTNNSEEITMTQYSQINYIRCNQELTFNGGSAIDIGDLNLPFIYGYNVKNCCTIPIVVQNGSNTMNGTAQLCVINNKLKMYPLVYDNQNSGWRVNSNDYIFFYNPKFNMETIYC